MDSTNIVCPVCTLYLRPGITLKNHLTSHPKQKVIEALVRLADAEEEPPKPECTTSTQSEIPATSLLNTSVVNQSWNQAGNIVNIPQNFQQMQGNHVFIYQQSMSTTGPQQNVLPQPYIIPTVLNPQMMPYIYQQQQLIMSSGSCMSPMPRSLPFELPAPTPAPSEPTTVIITEDHSSSGESDCEEVPVIEPAHHVSHSVLPGVLTGMTVEVEEDKEELQEEKKEEEEQIANKEEVIDLKEDEISEEKEGERVEEEPEYNEPVPDQSYNVEETAVNSPQSPTGSDWSLRVRSDLNKACQTQIANSSPRSVEDFEEEVIPQSKPMPQPTTGFYFVSEADNTAYTAVDLNYEQSNPIYTAAHILHADQLDFVDMDGMNVMMSDFSANQIISQVENFEGSAPDRPGVLMTIGGMVDTIKDFEHQRDAEESRESSNVNIRADERMPPRGELSGQESIGDTSDITWNRVHYHEGNSGMSTSYDLMARENWEPSDSSDFDGHPLHTRMPPHENYEPPDDNDTPTIVSFTGPPLNFKCSTCGDAFACLKERREHEEERHPEKHGKKSNRLIGSEIGKKKVKKLVVKPKQDKSEVEQPESKFDFTNKLKVENPLALEAESIVENQPPDAFPEAEVKVSPEDEIPSRMLTCTLCESTFLNVKTLREHKFSVHNITTQNKHKCATCQEVFPNDYKFSEHLRIHPLECKVCGRLFYRRQNIHLHMRRHLGIKPHKCEVCEKSFLTKQKLDEHRNIHTGDTPIKCTMCQETFRRHSNLVQHRNRHHLNMKKKVKDYICVCKEIFHSKKKLAWHKEIHDLKPKACSQCSEKFIHASSLTRHVRRAHNTRFLPNGHKNSENVECPICKGVYLKSSLEVHIRNHSGVRPYSCMICNKDFTTKWNLKLHKWTHASRVSKPYKCDQCKGAFIRESDYTAHMNSHKSIRPYTCNYCGAQFIRKYNCQRHVKEHESDKTFSCKECGKSFHRSYYLKDHLRIHTGSRPFSCHICGKTSTTKSNHNKHVQIHHAREPVSTEN